MSLDEGIVPPETRNKAEFGFGMGLDAFPSWKLWMQRLVVGFISGKSHLRVS